MLRGIRVLDFCWVGAGALVTKLLAEHGAEVIKIESHARPDNLRLSPPYAPGVDGLDRSGYFASRNNDKRSFALNMSLPRGRELARELASRCDLVTNNFRPGVMERWGLGYEDVARLNPSVIYLAMSMQGADGPNRHYVGFGSTIAALAGLVQLSGQPNREPVGTGTHYPDHIPSPGHALVAVLAAIRRREQTGRGALIEVSQLEATVNMVASAISAAALGEEPRRQGNRSDLACPSGVFRCRGEDEWCALAARSQEQWLALAAVLDDRPPLDGDRPLAGGLLLADARFVTLEGRRAHEDELELAIAALVADRDCNELASSLQAVGVPAWPVLSSVDLLEDEQLRERDFWRSLTHPVLGRIAAPSAPFRAGKDRTGPTQAAPTLGEHTRDLAHELLALSDQEIDALAAEQVLW
ncbi:MAG TPA: CoA transferase [Solirubrobacteraceae bacterium]|nr:CoA transferase [Solirubrobacteraceae bacterium]